MNARVRGNWGVATVAGVLLSGLCLLAGCKGDNGNGDRPSADPSKTNPGGRTNYAYDRRLSQLNLKQLGIAMYNYHNDYNRFPGAVAYETKVGKPGLSWRVALLPYVGEGQLGGQFIPDEPWDSEHNKKLIDKMPKIFAPGADPPEPGKTFYRVFTGPGTPFELGKGISLGQLGSGDGTSNTFMIVEAAEPVIWTKPDELVYDPKKPLPKLGIKADGFNAVFFDGIVSFITSDNDEQTLRNAITWNDGQPINLKKR